MMQKEDAVQENVEILKMKLEIARENRLRAELEFKTIEMEQQLENSRQSREHVCLSFINFFLKKN